MLHLRSSFLAGLVALAVGTSALDAAPSLMENLGRGVVAVRTSPAEVFVSWRILGTDPVDVSFNLYRSTGGGAPALLNGAPLTQATHFTDATADLTQANAYSVRPVFYGVEQPASAAYTLAAGAPVQQYLRVPLQRPAGGAIPNGETYMYSPNDASVGDVDGDGEYELVIKWEPSNARDSSNDGFTGNTYIDAYRLDGTQLWRIDLGINVRAGPHDTAFFVYDLDGDGRAEVFMRTAEGTRDGLGNFVADPARYQGTFPAVVDHAADRRGYPTNGRALVGPEFLTIFNGLTGAEIASTRYEPNRHPDTDFPTGQQLFDIWGDNFGNRQGRHYSPGVAYLDGQRPSIVMGRGYAGGQNNHPGRVALAAWNFRDGVITPLWQVATAGGSGAHSAVAADLDGDGRDDIVYGQNWVRHDGTLIERTSWGHGDALHVSQMDPDRPGPLVFMPHESPGSYGPNALSVDDGATGALVAGVQAGGDIGRGVAADIDPRFRGFEFWGSGGTGGLYNVQQITPNAVLGPRAVQVVATKPSSINHAVWWDGDLLRELLDNVSVRKWDWNTGAEATIFAPPGVLSNNGTKSNPSLQADILGDWREEIIWRESTNDAVRIYTTTIPTSHRFHTLMHDRQYRQAIVSQNVGYNQPPHTSFYLGDGMGAAPVPDIVTSLDVLLGPAAPVFTGITTDTGASASDQVTNDQTLVLHGTAEPGTTVRVTRLGFGPAGQTTANGAGLWSLDTTATTLPEGFALFSATATNADNVTGAPTTPPFVVEIDITPPSAPVIVDVADESGALVFVGTAEPHGVVRVLADGVTDLGTATVDASGSWTLVYGGPALGAGPHVFAATTTDVAGNTGPASVGADVNTSITTPVILGIADDTGASATDGITADTTLVFTGTAGPGDTVTLRRTGGAVLGSTVANGGGAWSFDHTGTVLSDGFYAFSAAASNAGGTSPSSPSFLVTIDTVAPAVVSIVRQNPTVATSTASSITFRVTFSESMDGVTALSFTPVFGSGLAGTIVDVVPAGPATIDVTLDLVGEGTVRLDVLAAGAGLADTAGNALVADFTSGQTYTRALVGDGVWIRSASLGLWSDNANWANGVIADTAGRTANFITLEIEEANRVLLDTPRTIGNLLFGDTEINTAASWFIDDLGSPANTLTLATQAGAPTITVNPLGLGATTTLDVSLLGNQGLTKLGAGTLVLRKPNLLTGAWNISAGSVQLTNEAVGSASTLSIAAGSGALEINGGQFTATGTTTANGNGGRLVINSGTGTFAAVNTNNSANGLIRVNGGTFTAASINIPRSSDGTPSFASGFVVTGGNATVTGPIGVGTNNSWGSVSIEGGNVLVGGVITLANQQTGGRGGQLRVTGGTFTATETGTGILMSRNNGANTNNVSTATFSGGTSTVEKFTLGFDSAVTGGSATITVNGGALYLGSGGIIKNGAAGLATNLNFSAGTVGAKANWSTALPINLPAGGGITFKAANTVDAPFEIALNGVLAGVGGFTKSGGGRLTLGGVNTFAGAVAVNGGTLDVAGSIGASANPVNVNSGGILSGAGTIHRAVALNAGGTIMPGTATAGSVLTTASLVWHAGGVLAYDLDGTSNRLAVSGAFTRGGDAPHQFVFNAGAGIAAGNEYALVSFDSTDFAASDFTFDTLAPGLTGAFFVHANDVSFKVYGPPIILESPRDAVVLMGGTATFTVEVGESPALEYQWFKDGLPIDGATGATLVVANVLAADTGGYHVVVSNAAGSTPSAVARLAIADVSLIRHAPSLSGADITGSLQQMVAGSVSLNGDTVLAGSLFVPGSPNVVLNGSPAYGGTIDGTGASSPTNYSITINRHVTLEHVVRRTDPVSLPIVAAPAAPAGTRSVTLNNSGQGVGDWATLRNLTLNNKVGPIAVPAGAYGNFTANGGGFILGVPGATQPSVYHFQQLTLNNSAQIQVVGPVIVVLGSGLNVNGGVVGNAAQSQWLTLNIFSGGLTLNGGGTAHGYVSAPSGTITVNGNSVVTGVVAADRLTINSNGELVMPAP